MKKYILFLIMVAGIVGIAFKTGGDKPGASKTNKSEANTIHAQYFIYHVNDTISELNYKIRSKELLYTRPDGMNFYSNVLISCQLVSDYDSRKFIDSTSIRLVDQNNDAADKLLIGKIKIHTAVSGKFYLRVTVSDLNRNTVFTTTLSFQKGDRLNRQNFIVTDKKTNTLLFTDIVKANEEVIINYNKKITAKLFVRYYNRDFALALPPFSKSEIVSFQYQPDSTFAIEMNNGMFYFNPDKKGFYHFQLDTTKREGLTLFNFMEAFPDVKKVDDMIPSLRYITSRDEFNELLNATDKKLMIDKFWLSCNKNPDQAREMIRIYYNRVKEANDYFSSYQEGWKTDRGMIYLIQGAPNKIYRDEFKESWIYGEENSISSVTYLFAKVNNPFTDNDYELTRSNSFKAPWYASVDNWRQGNVNALKN